MANTELKTGADVGVRGFACRGCGATVSRGVLDLGSTPLANSYREVSDRSPEPRFPLHVFICQQCLLVQLESLVTPEALFSDYAYFSSYSSSWLEHARRFAEQSIARFGLTGTSKVVEIASNDGYLLRNFVARDIPVLGVEPAANIAEVARANGVRTEGRFFGLACAQDLRHRGDAADLIVANNVVAHVPDLRDFLAGVAHLLKDDGVLSAEFPHLLCLIQETQFDTIYHEHFSYLSLHALEGVLASVGLRVFDAETLTTHGGSLRLFACHHGSTRHRETPNVGAVRAAEQVGGLNRLETYDDFAARVMDCRDQLVRFVGEARAAGKTVAAYGAAAKGNTLLNFCSLTADDIVCVADRSPHKQGRLLPGSHIPVVAPERLAEVRPDYLLILPWNLRNEIISDTAHVRQWGCRFVVPIPIVTIVG